VACTCGRKTTPVRAQIDVVAGLTRADANRTSVLLPPPSRNESAQVPHKHRQTRRIRFRLNVIPFVDPAVGVLLFAAALVKDTVNRIGDLLDDGQPNQSLKALSFTVPARECIGACR